MYGLEGLGLDGVVVLGLENVCVSVCVSVCTCTRAAGARVGKHTHARARACAHTHTLSSTHRVSEDGADVDLVRLLLLDGRRELRGVAERL